MKHDPRFRRSAAATFIAGAVALAMIAFAGMPGLWFGFLVTPAIELIAAGRPLSRQGLRASLAGVVTGAVAFPLSCGFIGAPVLGEPTFAPFIALMGLVVSACLVLPGIVLVWIPAYLVARGSAPHPGSPSSVTRDAVAP